jgi:carbamoyltransferase
MDIAASAQAVIEEAMFRLARHALRVVGSCNLCLAGGVALNCVANGRLFKRIPQLSEIWIQPASGDAGGAVGAALYLVHRHFSHRRHKGVACHRDGMSGSLLGPDFSQDTIETALTAAGLAYRRVMDSDSHDREVAQALAEGRIVGRFDGRMEYGPRALGNRSILADPRRMDGQSYINRRIKFRESWRPFAPAVLADKACEWFETEHDSPYMLLIADVRAELRKPVDWCGFRDGTSDMMAVLNQERSPLPAITHIDYSARLQTVDAASNPRFHRLMTVFHQLTGCPVLINTSFNVRGEPIVCTPADAVACFTNTGIDLLAIGEFLVFKDQQTEAIRSLEGKLQYEPD